MRPVRRKVTEIDLSGNHSEGTVFNVGIVSDGILEAANEDPESVTNKILLRKLRTAFGEPKLTLLYALLTSYILAIGPMGMYVPNSLRKDGELVSGDQVEPEQQFGVGR